jgi:type I restriction enzyme S subunit
MTKIREGYKKTKIGVIPEDWGIDTFENICVNKGLVRGPFGGALKKAFFVESGFKVYEQKNAIYKTTESGTYYINDEKYEELKRFAVKAGDFIVSCSGTIGRIYQIPDEHKEGVLNQALLKITTDSNVINDSFFYQYFEYNEFQKRIIDSTQGGAMKNLVGMPIIKKTLFPLPPIEEQKQIAEILSSTDEHIEKLDKAIEDYGFLKKGMMQKLLTQGINHTEFKDTKVGMIPKDWKVVSLKKLGDTFNGLTGVTKKDFGSGKPYIPYMNIFKNTKIDINNMDFVDLDGKKKQSKVMYGDIFFTTSSETPIEAGMSSVLLDNVDEMYLNSFCFGYRLNSFEVLRPEFARYLLRGQYARKEISRLAQGSTRFNLSKANVLKIEVPIPSIDEQLEIAQSLSDMEDRIKLLENERDDFINLKNALMERLLTGKVRVPSEEA